MYPIHRQDHIYTHYPIQYPIYHTNVYFLYFMCDMRYYMQCKVYVDKYVYFILLNPGTY
jgi:hypothetical protein